MKKWFLVLLAVFFTGCSTKTVYLPLIEKPDAVRNTDIRHLKVENIKNDSINLKENIIKQMQNVNKIVPGYFSSEGAYKTFLAGRLQKHTAVSLYFKKVPVPVKGPACTYFLYQCENIGTRMFCKNSPDLKLSPSQYSKIKKNAYSNSNYILCNKKIYMVQKTCRPTSAVLECEKRTLKITADIIIKNRQNKKVFEKKYIYSKTKDPCSDIDMFQGEHFYKADSAFDMKKASSYLAQKIIDDLAPHKTYIRTELYEKPDTDMNGKDENKFQDAADGSLPLNEKISIMSRLHKKYPSSCVIAYDLALFTVQTGNYKKAEKLLNKIYFGMKCNNDIKNSVYVMLLNLGKTYK
jgi:hypothetical protein